MRSAPTLAATLREFGAWRATPGEIPALRRQPGPIPKGWAGVPPTLLRSSDEQTVVGVAAAFDAASRLGGDPSRFSDWGVISASRFLGRSTIAQTLQKFDEEGVWGVSPHLIPHYALHATSGTIGLALGTHGPNLGVGGGPDASSQGFLAALSWLAAGVVPGVWLVLSGWSPELEPPPRGAVPWPGACHALALALEAEGQGGWGRFLSSMDDESFPSPEPIDLESLADRLRVGSSESMPIAWDRSGRFRVRFVPSAPQDGEGSA